jgi:GMP synthase PP-ATPase subunit
MSKYTVTWYSAFDKPQIFENVSKAKADELYRDGRFHQYKVEVRALEDVEIMGAPLENAKQTIRTT